MTTTAKTMQVVCALLACAAPARARAQGVDTVPTDTAADLDQSATTALTLNGGTILDPATNAATLTLIAPAAGTKTGCIDSAAWQSYGDWMKSNALITSTPDASAISTDTYLPYSC